MSFGSGFESKYRTSAFVTPETRPLQPGDAHQLVDAHFNFGQVLRLTSGRYDPIYAGWQSLPMLADQARLTAEQEAVSYREFYVGASAYVLDEEHARSAILHGSNLTPYKGAPKRCAELEVVQKAEALGYKKLLYLVVTGPLQPDEHSGVVSSTLHPCFDCRKLFLASSLIEDETVIVPIGENGETSEMFTVAELIALHAPESTVG